MSEPSIEEVNNVSLLLPNKSNTEKAFILSSLNNRYVVVAVSCKISENELDILDTSLEIFGHEIEKWEKFKAEYSDKSTNLTA